MGPRSLPSAGFMFPAEGRSSWLRAEVEGIKTAFQPHVPLGNAATATEHSGGTDAEEGERCGFRDEDRIVTEPVLTGLKDE